MNIIFANLKAMKNSFDHARQAKNLPENILGGSFQFSVLLTFPSELL